MKKSLTKTIGAFVLTFIPLSSSQAFETTIESIVNGEVNVNASDFERFSFLAYDKLRNDVTNGLSECEVLSAKGKQSLEVMSGLLDKSFKLYRDYGYCSYLELSPTANSIEAVNDWVERHSGKINYKYSYKASVDYYASLTTYSDWTCKNYRFALEDYESNSASYSRDARRKYDKNCKNDKATLK